MFKKVCIVIPLYNEKLNPYEEISLLQCLRILGKHDIYITHPKKKNIQLTGEFTKNPANIHFKSFPGKYFRSPQTYNRLLTSKKYFYAFRDYEYILMYHPDAFVFKDELADWCEKGYDYIGAPMYEYDGTIHPSEYLGIGNGGFSLHKTKSAIKVLSSMRRVYSIAGLLKWYLKYNWKGRIRYLPYFIRVFLGLAGRSHYLFNYLRLNEDVFWGVLVPKAFSWYRVPEFKEAIQFSMEYNCKKLYIENGEKLPFGCHQWYKGEFLEFWHEKIEACGYVLPKQ